MSELTEQIGELIDRTSEEERLFVLSYLRRRVPVHALEEQWGTTSEAILTAIARSSDLTLRGIRGILAEATFEQTVLPKLESIGWTAVEIVGDRAYDFLLERAAVSVRIQVKLQRNEAGVPKEYSARLARFTELPIGDDPRRRSTKDKKWRKGRQGNAAVPIWRFRHPSCKPSSINWRLEAVRLHGRQLVVAAPQTPGLD
jgi:hypothetical protein